MAPANDDTPRFGAFITMTVGILLFFGMVSRIHEIPGMTDSSAPDRTEQAASDPHQELEEARQRALAVFGRRDPNETYETAIPDIPQEMPRESESEAAPEEQPQRERQPAPQPERRRNPLRQHRYHVVKPGETLWKIAQSAYGDGSQYPLILRANPGLRADELQVGSALVIPSNTPDAMPADSGQRPASM